MPEIQAEGWLRSQTWFSKTRSAYVSVEICNYLSGHQTTLSKNGHGESRVTSIVNTSHEILVCGVEEK